MKNILLILLVCFSCSKGPKTQEIKSTIKNRLAQKFQKGLFEISDFSRRGSYSYSDKEGDKLLVYFKSTLKLNKDQSLVDDSKLNVGSLVYVMGATPMGIIGINPDGNKKGDVLTIHGTSSYKKNKNNWENVLFNSSIKAIDSPHEQKIVNELDQEKKLEASNSGSVSKYLEELQGIIRRARGNKLIQKSISISLESIIENANLQLARSNKTPILASGNKDGPYYLLAHEISKQYKSNKKNFFHYPTQGSAQNAAYINQKVVDFGFVQSDIDIKKFSNIRAVGSLFKEAIHIISTGPVDFKNNNSFKGKKINIGGAMSGSAINANSILKASKINLSKLIFSYHDIKTALDGLVKGTIDIVFFTAAYPSHIIQQYLSQNSLQLISLPESTINKLKENNLREISIPTSTYLNQKTSIKTLGSNAVLATHVSIDKEKIEDILETLISKRSEMGRNSVQALQIKQETLKAQKFIPYHPSALDYLK